jgi:protein-S-isoprenylcysteine O-methyltransferase Ste14
MIPKSVQRFSEMIMRKQLLVTLVPFALVIRYRVVAREEAYLERRFGEVYRRYCAHVRRWL